TTGTACHYLQSYCKERAVYQEAISPFKDLGILYTEEDADYIAAAIIKVHSELLKKLLFGLARVYGHKVNLAEKTDLPFGIKYSHSFFRVRFLLLGVTQLASKPLRGASLAINQKSKIKITPLQNRGCIASKPSI
ncbi:MAG: hypothetical protein ACK5LK_08760, partial [Chthoniobacterales bacterium]